MAIYYDDLAVGDEFSFGEEHVTEADIIEFAEAYDPQPIHVDPAVGRESMYGSIIASGIHTIALATKLTVNGVFGELRNLGGRGLDDVRWHKPVFPGDTLSVTLTVEAMEIRDPERSGGDVSFKQTVMNQDGDVVLTLITNNIVERRSEPAE